MVTSPDIAQFVSGQRKGTGQRYVCDNFRYGWTCLLEVFIQCQWAAVYLADGRNTHKQGRYSAFRATDCIACNRWRHRCRGIQDESHTWGMICQPAPGQENDSRRL